ncbi:MAG TPA: zinc ribbon domain-containing protein [Pyrinomonadaceae bacterium]|nr:zinc ribbon domain-containing protein [Pyrinomonadaceae bacterium]
MPYLSILILRLKMNCPTCGLQTTEDQKFCRSCGAGLRMTTRPLAAPATLLDLERTSAIGFKREGQRGNRLTLWGFIIMFIGVAIGVIGKMLLHQEMVTVVGVLVSLVGMFLTVYPYLSPSPRQTHDSIPSSQPEVLTRSQSTKYLPQESNIEHVPSITERTTELLKNSAATRPEQKQDGESQA